MSEPIFKRGNIVQLASGGDRMTVKTVHREWSPEQEIEIANKIADEYDETASLTQEELENLEDEPWPEGSILTGYTCIWKDAAGNEHEKFYEPELLVRRS